MFDWLGEKRREDARKEEAERIRNLVANVENDYRNGLIKGAAQSVVDTNIWGPNTVPSAQREQMKGIATTRTQELRTTRVTNITLEECSNGTIIRIGSVVRICPTDGNLFDEVAAAYTESRL